MAGLQLQVTPAGEVAIDCFGDLRNGGLHGRYVVANQPGTRNSRAREFGEKRFKCFSAHEREDDA